MSAEDWAIHCERLAAWDRIRRIETANTTSKETS